MPKVELRASNLVPGKRYRMVIETTTQSAVGPSIEFVVPSAPRLISTYTPTYNIVPENYSIELKPATTAPGAMINVGDEQSAKNYDFKNGLRGTTRVKGSRRYIYYTNLALESFGKGTVFRVRHPDGYYDQIPFTVDHIQSGSFTVVNNNGGKETLTKAIHADAANKKYPGYSRTGDAYSTDTNSGNTDIYYSRPALPAVAYRAPDVNVPAVMDNGTYQHVDVSLPSEIEKDLYVKPTDGVAKVPVFFYIQGGAYYYFGGAVVGTTPLSLTSVPVIEMKKRNSKANKEASLRDYRFTIARYTKQGSTWVGEWEQPLDTYESIGPSFSRVVVSQSAVKA
jgi:hypothetical protein